MKKTNNLSWGLFNFRGHYFWRNIKDIPIFIKRIFFTLKHGYSPQAQWETSDWFIDTMHEIFTWHRYHRMGTGYILDEPPEIDNDEQFKRNIKAYNDGLDKMIELLDRMDERNEIYDNLEPDDWEKIYKMREAACEEFFKLFKKYFYYLWD